MTTIGDGPVNTRAVMEHLKTSEYALLRPRTCLEDMQECLEAIKMFLSSLVMIACSLAELLVFCNSNQLEQAKQERSGVRVGIDII